MRKTVEQPIFARRPDTPRALLAHSLIARGETSVTQDQRITSTREWNGTVIAFVRQFFPRISEKKAEFILWERTAFPLCDVSTLENQLRRERRRWTRRPHRGWWKR